MFGFFLGGATSFTKIKSCSKLMIKKLDALKVYFSLSFILISLAIGYCFCNTLTNLFMEMSSPKVFV